ncbi:MAG: hypothetical protein VX550_04120 [Bacteroidota bacterium]|nr:hypothetical protein [Bacteroidota bacterium]
MIKASKNNYGVLLIFILGSAIVWFILKYGSTYQDNVDIEINWDNLPIEYEFENQNNTITVPAVVRGSGYSIIYRKLFNYQVNLDFKEWVRTDSNPHFIPNDAFIAINQMTDGLSLVSLSNKPVTVDVYRKLSKKVPIDKNLIIDFKDAYRLVEEPIFSIDSVLISGAEGELSGFKYLVLDKESITLDRDTTTVQVDLNKYFKAAKVAPNELTITFIAQPYTEFTTTKSLKDISIPNNYYLTVDSLQVKGNKPLNTVVNRKDLSITLELPKILSDSLMLIPSVSSNIKELQGLRTIPNTVMIVSKK